MRPMVTARRRSPRPRLVIVWSAVGLVLWATGAWAATREESCQADRAKAAGKYSRCIQYEVAKYYSGSGDPAKLGKCVTKYGATWGRLQAKSAGTGATCDNARFQNNGNTVTDRLTTLQWEKKTDDGSLHDKDNFYSWSTVSPFAQGTVFTTFLAGTNCAFDGQCDWRLPTLAELLSITQPAYPDCGSPPCIASIFGPTQSANYWSSSTSQPDPALAWHVFFASAFAGVSTKTSLSYVRAVRGGF